MSSIRESRVVEIYSKGPNSYGTGYLLGGGIILTARHVLVPGGPETVPAKLDIAVRTVGMTRRREEPVQATLVWPPGKENLSNHAPDIALIRMAGKKGQVPERPPALHLVGQAEGADTRFVPELRVYAVGFPLFATMPEGGRDTNQITGVVQPGAGLVTDTLEISKLEFGRDCNNRAIDASADWKGFSGAALFAHGAFPNASDALPQLIGVVVTHQRHFRYDFGAVRIDTLLEDNDAAEHLNAALGRSGRAEAPRSPLVHKLVCLVDRADQEREFVESYRRATPAPDGVVSPTPQTAQPVISLLPGAGFAGHAAEEMVERLKARTLPEWLRWPAACLGVAPLYWPAARSAEEAVRRLREDLWNRLAGKGSAPVDPAAYAQLLKDGTRPRLFVSDLLRRPLDEANAGVLALWSEFWAGLIPDDRRVPVHLLLLDANEDRAEAWHAMASHTQGVLLGRLPELDACLHMDLDAWLAGELPSRVPSAHQGFLSRLETQLRKDYPDRFFLRDLKTRVQELVNEEFNA